MACAAPEWVLLQNLPPWILTYGLRATPLNLMPVLPVPVTWEGGRGYPGAGLCCSHKQEPQEPWGVTEGSGRKYFFQKSLLNLGN